MINAVVILCNIFAIACAGAVIGQILTGQAVIGILILPVIAWYFYMMILAGRKWRKGELRSSEPRMKPTKPTKCRQLSAWEQYKRMLQEDK